MSVRAIGTTLVLIAMMEGMVRFGAASAEWSHDGVPICTIATHQQYPRLVNPSTTISFMLREPERVQLTVYTVNGDVVRGLVDREVAASRYEVTWNGRDERAHQVASGIYLYTLETRSFSETKRMVLIK